MTTGQRAVAAIRAHLAASGGSWAKLTGEVVASIIDAAEAKEQPKRAPRMADGPWLETLKADPANEGLDIDAELVKMRRWCQQHNKQPTRNRFVNWLNHADRSIAPGRVAINALPELQGWRLFLEERAAEFPLDGSPQQIPATWDELPRSTREVIHGQKHRLQGMVEFARDRQAWAKHLEQIRKNRETNAA